LLIDKIKELTEFNSLSKHEQLVHGVIESIDEGFLKTGDKLPSINVMVEELGFARKTIVRAYEELKERGLVESKKLKGYFIISQETKVTMKVALLLFAFQSFQKEFYNTFRKELGKRFQIDVYFHHNNLSIFETIVANIRGKYGKYVIAPIQSPKVIPLLERIAPQKLLIIDRYVPMREEYSYLSQEFEKKTYEKLVVLLPEIRKYKKFILFFRDDADYPIGILNAFHKFISDHDINGVVEKKYKKGMLKKKHSYFFISDTFLWEFLKDCRNAEYKVGKDVGILSHNDNVVKEFIFGGITTISIDFKEMAMNAAHHIKEGGTTQLIVPSNLIKRNSI